jgi:mycofactocin system glycosyltransferase
MLTTEFVAFLDSDCVPEAGWLAALIGHFEDPLVGAVAPRVRALRGVRGGPLVRYLASRSPLDMGARESAVEPGGRVAYVPSAALLVRSCVLEGGFDERLRYGEDVDFVWRTHDAGWRVRYDPRVHVAHEEPATLRCALVRRFRYGASAAALCRRHPRRLAPVVLSPTPSAAALLLAGRRPSAAAGLLLLRGITFVARVRRQGVSRSTGARWYCEATSQAVLSIARYAATLGLPLAAASAWRARKPALLGLLALPALSQWRDLESDLDPIRWTALAVADDAAYAAGVVWSSVRARDYRPLLPAFGRSRSSADR